MFGMSFAERCWLRRGVGAAEIGTAAAPGSAHPPGRQCGPACQKFLRAGRGNRNSET